MVRASVFATALLVARAHAGIDGLVAEGLTRGNLVERRMMEVAETFLVRRQADSSSPDSASSIVLNQDGSINMDVWNQEAQAACTTALSHLHAATNPSGTCVCYNLPALDNTTGTFEADLRLYQLSEPTGAFAGISQDKIQVGLTYHGASVSPVTEDAASKAVLKRQLGAPADGSVGGSNGGGDGSITASSDSDGGDEDKSVSLKLLQTYLFVGQMDKDKMKGKLDSGALQALVMPTITLTGTGADGRLVSTNVSTNEAAFVAGVFSKEVVLSDFARANAAVEEQKAGLANNTVAFVLPGVQFMIFPIGLVITGIWLVIGMAVIGLGWFERLQYAEKYRRAKAIELKGAAKRI